MQSEINRKENSLVNKNTLSESGRQFAEIFEKHHNPESRELSKLIKNRKKRVENLKSDLGL